MKLPRCPYCLNAPARSGGPSRVVRFGYFYRHLDQKCLYRYRCTSCRKTFSCATLEACYRQRKRSINPVIASLLCSGVSQRRIALLLKLNRKTVVRKFIFLGQWSLAQFNSKNLEHKKCEKIEFDELETFEHTKCKPLSVPLAVDSTTRRILGFSVASMPAKGLLAEISRKKYGLRRDDRKGARQFVLTQILPLVNEQAIVKSDQNPHYPLEIKKHFPKAQHIAHKGQRGAITGQGELKKIRFDPLFSLNHTCAMLRANINRLFRKTWCTTKKAERLHYHIALYALVHNQKLI